MAEEGEQLQKAKAAVDGLCRYSTHFFEEHGVERAAKKWEDVKHEMEKTVSLLNSLQNSIPKVHYWSLKGRALNILPEHSQEAETCLSQAIKHDPTLIETWNALGESYWKAGNIQQAHNCFTGSLAHSQNKEALRNLSMVLRQLGKDTSEKEANTKESVEKAKAAVAMDVQDGTSWMILGNAYLSLFFMTGQDPKILKQCISAYIQADRDPVSANNPDLHYNRATLCQYEEDYQGMLKELQLAAALDPEWDGPRERLKSTWDFLTSMSLLISSKGKLKSKTLSGILESLSSPEQYLGEVIGDSGKRVVSLSDLKQGANLEKVVVVGVAAIVPSKEKVPYACVVLDKASECLGLTVYNLASTTQFAVGNILTLSEPTLLSSTVEYNGEVVEVRNIQVANPSQLLLGGRKLDPSKLAPSAVSVTAFN